MCEQPAAALQPIPMIAYFIRAVELAITMSTPPISFPRIFPYPPRAPRSLPSNLSRYTLWAIFPLNSIFPRSWETGFLNLKRDLSTKRNCTSDLLHAPRRFSRKKRIFIGNFVTANVCIQLIHSLILLNIGLIEVLISVNYNSILVQYWDENKFTLILQTLHNNAIQSGCIKSLV